MLSFKELSEKKTKIKINPKQSEITEKSCDSKKKCSKCEGKGCKHCGGTGYHGEEEVSEAKKKDDTYLETDFKKRQKNNEKARKDLMKGPQMKNPHFESTEETAYVSQEEVSEELKTFNNLLASVLEGLQVEEIGTVGENFDPSMHEAVEHSGEGETQVVETILRKGYLFQGKLIRPAMVKVKSE